MRTVKDVEFVRDHHATWRLLRSDNAPLTIAFLGTVFVDQQTSSIKADDLEELLTNWLHDLHRADSNCQYRGDARSYLTSWSHGAESGWLRKFYPTDSQEVHYEATSALARAVDFVDSLRPREFVGTESRMSTLVDILRNMAFDAEPDTSAKLATLKAKRRELDKTIAELEAGHQPDVDTTLQRDRYQQFRRTHQELMADFREVEENFRDLDRNTRQLIAQWDGPKGDLLDIVFTGQSSIAQSDQGRTVRAFHTLLMSPGRQQELQDLITAVAQLPYLDDTEQLRSIANRWFEAALRTQHVMRSLSRQLNRFLDDKVWLENQRVQDLLRTVQQHALSLRDSHQQHNQEPPGMTIDGHRAQIHLPLERPLFTVKERTEITATPTATAAEANTEALATHTQVDPLQLAANVHKMLDEHRTVSLADLTAASALTAGIEELVAYLVLDDEDVDVLRDDDHRTAFVVDTDANGTVVVDTPHTVYRRKQETR